VVTKLLGSLAASSERAGEEKNNKRQEKLDAEERVVQLGECQICSFEELHREDEIDQPANEQEKCRDHHNPRPAAGASLAQPLTDTLLERRGGRQEYKALIEESTHKRDGRKNVHPAQYDSDKIKFQHVWFSA
jgi:hypothetical protein